MSAKLDSIIVDLAEKQAAQCRILGNPRRLLILWVLSDEELSVNEIAARVGSTLQNISQHLNLLKSTGFVISRREGQTIYYQIADRECLRNRLWLFQAPERLAKYS